MSNIYLNSSYRYLRCIFNFLLRLNFANSLRIKKTFLKNVMLSDLNLELLTVTVTFNSYLLLLTVTFPSNQKHSLQFFAPPLLSFGKAFLYIFFLLQFLKLFCYQEKAQRYFYHIKRNLQKVSF